MKTRTLFSINRLSLAVAAVLFLSAPAYAGQGPGGGMMSGATADHATTCAVLDTSVTPSASEVTALQFMHEEEKLARDVYTALYAQWQQPVFTNIARSEQTHMDQMKCFLDAYGLQAVASTEAGVFNTPDLQTLYDDLTARGEVSLSEALRVGALVEEVDMLDLADAITASELDEVKSAYANLLKGSENHLRAFVGNLQALGETYTAQAMEQDAVNAVLAGSAAVTATGINVEDQSAVASQAQFVTRTRTSTGRQGNGLRLTQQEQITLDVDVLPDTAHVGRQGRMVYVAMYQRAGTQAAAAYQRDDTGQWQAWSGDMRELGAGEQRTLQASQQDTVFAGDFADGAGAYQVYCGYLLDDGDLIFTSVPTELEVLEVEGTDEIVNVEF